MFVIAVDEDSEGVASAVGVALSEGAGSFEEFEELEIAIAPRAKIPITTASTTRFELPCFFEGADGLTSTLLGAVGAAGALVTATAGAVRFAGAFLAAFLATFLAGAFFATFLTAAFFATFLITFLAGAFFAAFFAGAFLAAFLATL